MTQPKQLPPTTVRIPEDLKAMLKEKAGVNDRSLNGEILARLRSTFNGKRTQQPSNSKE